MKNYNLKSKWGKFTEETSLDILIFIQNKDFPKLPPSSITL